jgi:alpha-glucosidase
MFLCSPSAWGASVHHDGSPSYVALHGATATLRLRADRTAPLRRVVLRTCPDGEQALTPMRPAGADAACQWWEVDLALAMPRTGYRFWLESDDGGWWLTQAGLARHTPTDATDFKLLSGYHAPGWLRGAVFYQIFPDRFADGDPGNNVRTGEYHLGQRPVVARRWGERPDRASGATEFFGGDLQGIVQRLPYLADLGVSAIYLNPIFTAPSNHKYDTADYEHVDPHLGGDAALAALRRALDTYGMRLVLDVVPNHCGATHPWFTAAQRDPHAPTAEFFTFRRHPHEYEAWLGHASLPKLNYRSQRLREAMYAGADAILRRWLRPPYRIDGWRVDVANMLARQGESQLGHKIGRGLRRAVKAENPDAYLLGEHFYDGTPHLQGDELDATMNYRGFSIPLLEWLTGRGYDTGTAPSPLPTEALAAQWRAFMAAVPWQIAAQQLNLLGSHDTPRIRALLGGDQTRMAVATALLFTFPGVSSIYYGDEIGLEGGPDPDCRRCMPWDVTQWDHDLLAHYRRLIVLRRESVALREGGFQLLYAAGDTIALLREARAERLLVVARRAADGLQALLVRPGGIADGTRFRDALSGAVAAVTGGYLSLDGLSAPGVQVWRSVACEAA